MFKNILMALLNVEEDVKSKTKLVAPEKVSSDHNQNEASVAADLIVNNSSISVSTVTSQQVNSQQLILMEPQVIKMNEYKVILSSGPIPSNIQGKEKKAKPVMSLPSLRPKTDTAVVIGDQQLTFTSFSNIDLVGHNQFSTILIKDVKSTVPENVIFHSSTFYQPAAIKKSCLKTNSKNTKIKKKQTHTKQIMLKPPSSLLSQSALDFRSKDTFKETKSCDITSPTSNETKSSLNLSEELDITIKGLAEPVALVTSNSSSIPTTNIVTTSEKFSMIRCNDKPEYCQPEKNLTSANISYNSASVKVVGHSIINYSNVLITTDSSISEEQTLNLNNEPVLDENVLIDSNTKVICSEDQEPLLQLHTSLDSNSIMAQHSNHHSDLTNNQDYQRDHETILPSDIEHHEEHHTQEYTNKLLSQLSNARVLPNMSSSQVSSVLNALGSSEKTNVNGLGAINNINISREIIKCEPTENVKYENLQVLQNMKINTKMSNEPKYRACELNKHTCFRCVNCMFLSLNCVSVERHWLEYHQPLIQEKRPTKRQIKCFGCTNIFYSKYSLQIHLLCDHNVIATEVQDLITATLSANKTQRELKRQSTIIKTNSKAKLSSQQVEPNNNINETSSEVTASYIPALTSVANQPLQTVAEPAEITDQAIVIIESAKIDEQKSQSRVVQNLQIPPTPSFTLFSDLQLPSDKEEIVLTDYSIVNEKNKFAFNKKQSKSPRVSRVKRIRIKPDIISDIKLTYRCLVERCGVRLSCSEKLEYHLRCHSNEPECGYSCPECDYRVVSWSSLTPHLWRSHAVDMDLYTCNHCNYKSNSYSKMLNNHIKIHGDERPFLCDTCGKGFKTTKQLRNHKVIHRARRRFNTGRFKSGECEIMELDATFSEYICNICSRSFADSRILKHHTENVHNKSRPYLCTFCSHTASSKSSLRMHIRQHTGEKPFSCDQCEYVTSDHNSLRRHKMRHTGKRPYQCPHCAYNCIQSTTYKSHLKNKHPGMDAGLLFSCSMCPFRTIKKDNYLAHKAEHDLGGDPRGRRKKNPLSLDITQENSELENTVAFMPNQHDVAVLLNSSNHITSIENQSLQLSVPEDEAV